MSEVEKYVNPEFKYFNENISWLQFNQRVANEASRSSNPILERLNFLGIADSNLDEFIRTKLRNDMKNRKEVSKKINEQTKFIESKYEELISELREKYSINITTVSEIKENQKAYNYLKDEFNKNIYPILQPFVTTNKLPIPPLSDGSTFIVTQFEDDERNIGCIIRMPDTQLIKVKHVEDYKQTFVLIEDVIEEFIYKIYRKKNISRNDIIRVIREIDSLKVKGYDYLRMIKKQILDREHANIVMVDYHPDGIIPSGLFDGHKINNKRKRKYVYGLSFLKNIKDYVSYTDDMVYPKAKPRIPITLLGESMFDILSEHDVLIHYPYESFDMAAVRFIDEAATDPDVVSIKQTLYRVGKDSPIVNSLIKGVKNGKQVVVLLELKAKMDEKNNLELTEKLENAGVNVIFGPLGIKTHAKITLVVRKEKNKIAKYINVSTGNFNDKTAKIYEDLSYFVKERSKLKIGTDLTDLFNYLGGYCEISEVNDLLISPVSFRPKIEKEINKCILCKQTHPDVNVTIRMKCNSFTDIQMCNKLYEASNAGVKISLIIRGMCILYPGIKDQSENIEVISIVGRYLEHSRIYEFKYVDEENVNITKQYIGSGDMMERNLDNRVEVIVPIKTDYIKSQITDILDDYMRDNTNRYELLPTGQYQEPTTVPDDIKFSVQENYIKKYKKLEKGIARL